MIGEGEETYISHCFCHSGQVMEGSSGSEDEEEEKEEANEEPNRNETNSK